MERFKRLFLLFSKKIDQESGEKNNAPKISTIESPNIWTRNKWQLMLNASTVLVVIILLLTVPSLAATNKTPSASSISTISYQGQLTDSENNPITGLYAMEFRIYDVASEGTALWSEMWTDDHKVEVTGGLFNVLLGSINYSLSESIAGYTELYLGIKVGEDSEMVPRVQLSSVPFSMQAMTVPDGSITTEKIEDEAITLEKLGPDIHLTPSEGSITTSMIADGAITQIKAPQLLKSIHRQDRITDVVTQTNQYLSKGWGCWGPTDGTTQTYQKPVSFPVTYDDVPIIVLSISGDIVDTGIPPTSHGGVGMDLSYKPIFAAFNQGPTGFIATLLTNPTYPAGHYSCFTWMAVGTVLE